MTQEKHTPGPWVAGVSHDGNQFMIVSVPAEGEVAVVQSIRCLNQINRTVLSASGEEKANARLLAAAPELLEALDYLLQQTVDQDLKHGIALSEGEEDARQRALAVIAKVAA